jgi:hypothetical protein
VGVPADDVSNHNEPATKLPGAELPEFNVFTAPNILLSSVLKSGNDWFAKE